MPNASTAEKLSPVGTERGDTVAVSPTREGKRDDRPDGKKEESCREESGSVSGDGGVKEVLSLFFSSLAWRKGDALEGEVTEDAVVSWSGKCAAFESARARRRRAETIVGGKNVDF